MSDIPDEKLPVPLAAGEFTAQPPMDGDLGISAPFDGDLPEQTSVAVASQYKTLVQQALANCNSRREVLELETDSLAVCVGIAAEIFQNNPCPDNSYQLAALTNAHNSSLTQLEKMKDPKLILDGIEGQIKNMFTVLVRALVMEIDKTKKEFGRLYPNDKSTTEDMFNRMLASVSPETQKLYDDLHAQLKKVLGIKK